jgi:hypothetical protein
MNSSSKELDILLHQELKRSERLCEEVSESIVDLSNIIDEFEFYKSKLKSSGQMGENFSDYLKSKSRSRSPSNLHKDLSSLEHSSSTTVPPCVSFTPVVMSTSSLLNKLGKLSQ